MRGMSIFPAHPNFHVVDHPLIQHKLTYMRDATTGVHGFRALLREISLLIGYEISRGLKLTTRAIATPMVPMHAPTLVGPAPCVVPVLRAGLTMADGLVDLIPDAQIGHVGIYRDHDTKRPVEYLVRLPKEAGQCFFVTDPMLATGHSLAYTCDVLIRHGVKPENISCMVLVAAPEGVAHMAKTHPTIKIYSASLDEKLDANAYILPGLGDAGDRLFGTM